LCLLVGGLVAARAADSAKDVWEKDCQKCHGADGKGDTKMGKKVEVKDLTDAAVQTAAKDADLTKAIKEGVKDKEGKERMKAYADLTDDQVKELVAVVRAFKK
jgi:mono/diheme cytochrome c family protein